MSAREWQPGDVAMLGSSVALRVTYDPFGCPATHAHDGDHWHRATGDWVIDGGGIEPHPLIVIDPEDDEQVERLIRALPDAADWGFLHDSLDDEGPPADVVDGITEDFQAALREFANPTPPKPEEPTGLGAVVEAGNGDRWVRIETGRAEHDGIRLWICEADGDAKPRPWQSVAAVRVLSEGVTQ